MFDDKASILIAAAILAAERSSENAAPFGLGSANPAKRLATILQLMEAENIIPANLLRQEGGQPAGPKL